MKPIETVDSCPFSQPMSNLKTKNLQMQYTNAATLKGRKLFSLSLRYRLWRTKYAGDYDLSGA